MLVVVAVRTEIVRCEATCEGKMDIYNTKHLPHFNYLVGTLVIFFIQRRIAAI